MYIFDELDDITRLFMLEEFGKEENSPSPYRCPRLSELGMTVFPRELEKALRLGNEESLCKAMSNPEYFQTVEYVETRGGKTIERVINCLSAAQALARMEFNAYYVRGLAARMIADGEYYCQVCEADPEEKPSENCLDHAGKILKVRDVYQGRRARYWPPPGKPDALCLPAGPDCNHTIKRVVR